MEPEAVFYLSVADIPRFIYRFCCKMQQEKRQVWLAFDDEAQMRQTDTQLWAQEETGFLPHEIAASDSLDAVSVILTDRLHEYQLPESAVVVNFTAEPLADMPVRARIVEISADYDAAKHEARRRFAAYRARGFSLKHHDMQGKS